MPIERPDWNLPATVPSTDVAVSRGEIRHPDWGPGGEVRIHTPMDRRRMDQSKHAAWRDGKRSAADAPAQVNNGGEASESGEDIDAELDAEEARADQQILALGIMTKEELARFRGRPVDEIGKPRLTRHSIEQELAAIRKTMREDRRTYDKDTKMQARYRELITAREDAIEVAWQTEQTQTTVQAVLDAVEDPEAFEGDFDSMFGSLPEHTQTAIRHEFAQRPDDPARPASEADVKRFASVPEHAELVREWGREAPRKLAIVRTRLDRLLSAGEMEAASLWFDELPAAEAKAVLNALAGR